MSDPEQAHDAANAWAAQVGPAYTRAAVAELLGIPVQAVSKRKGLLALEQRDGSIVYPVFQFSERAPLDGIASVVRIMTPVVQTEWTIAAMLTAPQVDLGGRTPAEAVGDGDVEHVLLLTRQAANAMAR